MSSPVILLGLCRLQDMGVSLVDFHYVYSQHSNLLLSGFTDSSVYASTTVEARG